MTRAVPLEVSDSSTTATTGVSVPTVVRPAAKEVVGQDLHRIDPGELELRGEIAERGKVFEQALFMVVVRIRPPRTLPMLSSRTR